MDVSAQELEGMLNRILASQQPFFTDLLTRIASHESREIHRDEALGKLALAVELLVQQNLKAELDKLDKRIEILENREHKWQGMKDALNALPKWLGYLAIGIAGVMMYYDAKWRGK